RKSMQRYPATAPFRRRFSLFSLSNVIAVALITWTLVYALLPQTAGAMSGSAFVRVNQVGYATDASKRAYLMASGLETGATFHITNAHGVIVYSAPIGENLG